MKVKVENSKTIFQKMLEEVIRSFEEQQKPDILEHERTFDTILLQ